MPRNSSTRRGVCWNRSLRFLLVPAAVAVAIAATAAAASAGGGSWLNASNSGDWALPGNWSSDGTPTSADDVSFGLSTSYTVNFSSDSNANNLDVLAGDSPMFSLGGFTLTTASDFNIGATSGTVAVAQLTVTGGMVNATADTNVGYYGQGVLTIDQASTQFNTTSLYVGNGDGNSITGTGTVNVSNGAQLTATGSVSFGSGEGSGALNVSGGAVVQTGSALIGASSYGDNDPTQNFGQLSISGTGSSYAVHGDLAMGVDSATSTATIQNSGALTVDGTLQVGGSYDSPNAGTGTMTVQCGGTVNAQDIRLGYEGGTSTINVLSGGSLTATDTINVSSDSEALTSALLYIDSGGSVSAPTINVLPGGLITMNGGQITGNVIVYARTGTGPGGNGGFNGFGTVIGNVSNVGFFQIPVSFTNTPQAVLATHARSAAALVDTAELQATNYTQDSNATLALEIGGTDPSQYSKLVVTGMATLDGTLSISLINNFQPSLGDSYDVLNLNSHNGSFATVSLPTLQSGLGWDQSALYTQGVLSIATASSGPTPTEPVSTAVFEGGSLTGTLSAGEVKWFKFTHAGGDFSVDTHGTTLAPSNDTILALYASDGTLITLNDDDHTDPQNPYLSTLSVSDLAAGTYFVALSAYSTAYSDGFDAESSSNNTGDFELNGLSVPEPGAISLLAVMGAGTLLRRRSSRRRAVGQIDGGHIEEGQIKGT